VTERPSLNPTAHSHNSGAAQSFLSTKSKLMKANSILLGGVSGNSKQQLGQIYQRHEEYMKLVKEWKHLEIFDETDHFVCQLVEHYLKVVEEVMGEAVGKLAKELEKYERVVE
jgi:hypothetical protein